MSGFNKSAALSAFVVGICAASGVGQTFQINPVADNTLYQDVSGGLSNGAGTTLYAGRTGPFGGNAVRRALLRFDPASIAPPGTVCVHAELTMEASQTNGPNMGLTLRRVTSAWGEGTSDAGVPGGAGAPSTPGDATWIHGSFPGVFWTTAGGDFSNAVSALTSVAGPGAVTWSSTAALKADVDDMIANPGSNFGWIITTAEIAGQAVRFESRESVGQEPYLTLVFAPSSPLASSTVVGSGCPGTNSLPFSLATTSAPIIGDATFAFSATNGPPFAVAQLVLSTGVAAPSPIGGGCNVYVDLPGFFLYSSIGFGPFPIFLDPAGNGSFFLPIPPEPTLSGFTLAVQCVAPDAAAPAFVVLSNALLLVAGV